MATAKTRGRKAKKQPEQPDPMESLKLEVADDLGLLDKVKRLGWGGLSARETGQVGGHMTRRLKEMGLIGAE